MKKKERDMKILNLYSGIGGNRRSWQGHEIVAVEQSQVIADIYQYSFPKDNIVVGDAHQYLLDHYNEFDFIWSSPPCQTHSSFRQNICVRFRGTKAEFPDMRLYQEILFLQANFNGKWVVENVKPYYKPLIEPTVQLQRHLFWSNFPIKSKEFAKEKIRKAQIPQLQEYHNVDLSTYKIPNKRQVLRNCVYYEVGEYILSQVKENL